MITVEMSQWCCTHFIRKTAKGPMCCLTKGHVSPKHNRTYVLKHWKKCISADKVTALEDQMLACLTGSNYSVSNLGI